MTVKNDISEFLFRLIVGTMYVYALSEAILGATVLRVPKTFLLALCILYVMLFCAFFLNRRTVVIFFISVTVITAVLFIPRYWPRFETQWSRELDRYTTELLRFIAGEIPYREEYSRILGAVIVFLLSMVTIIFFCMRYSIVPLTALGLGVFIVPVYMQWNNFPPTIWLFALCFVVLLFKKLTVYASPKGSPKAAAFYALLLLPACLLVFGAAKAAPKPDIDVEDLKFYTIDSADGMIADISESRILSFSDNASRLGGPVIMDNYNVMEVTANDRVYLRGSVRDTYTGSSWTSRDGKSQPLPVNDTEWYISADDVEGCWQNQLYFMRYYGLKAKSVTVNIHDTRTKTIFTPPSRWYLWVSGGVVPQVNALGEISAEKPLARNTVYTQQYIPWDYESPYFIQILQNKAVYGVYVYDLQSPQYLALPESLPGRVTDLAHELTDRFDNNYDKLKALEEYIAQFPYTLEPANIPPNRDFVDYFLFDGQEGYCVYYASALAVMARSVGIPTRYVEGFVTPGQRNENGNFTVTNAQAHAWVEAFFPNFGWVCFEATSPYRLESFDPEPAPESVPERRPEPEPQKTPAPAPAAPTPEMEKTGAVALASVLILLPAAALVFLLVRRRAKNLRRRAKIEKIDEMPNAQAAQAWFGQIVGTARPLGYPMLDGETALSYAGRVNETLTFDTQSVRATDLAEIFSRAAYSRRAVTDQERHIMKSCYYELRGKLREASKKRLRLYNRKRSKTTETPPPSSRAKS